MAITRYQFEVLAYLEKNGSAVNDVKKLADILAISAAQTESVLSFLVENGLISSEGDSIKITDAGIESLEPYRVKTAVIMAAGFGERMVPATLKRPKPMVTVNGVRIIDTLLDALIAAGIKDIRIVRGYKKEIFDELLEKYPFITFIDNDDYNKTNNISSAMMGIENVKSCYLCEADLIIYNPDVIRKYQYSSNILGSYSFETDDWCFRMKNGCVSDFQKGNTFCYTEYGISFWSEADIEMLKADYSKVFNEYENGKNLFWDYIPFILFIDKYNIEIRPCNKSDIIEIDSYQELVLLDPSYEEE